MVGNDDAHLASSRKMFWRSASWSSARSAAGNSSGEPESNFADPNLGAENPNRRFPPPPLTPRSQQSKARSCLPPLQPLSIARRSLDEWPKASSDDIGEWPQPPTTPGGRGNYSNNSNSNNNGERLKLDLSSIQQNNNHSDNRNNGGLVKRDKIAFFDKECSKVAEHVYLGGDAVAKDRDILKRNGITHVLNCVGFVCPEYFKADFVYRTLWLQDSPSEDITSILYDVFDYFEDVRENNGRVFVHCCQGVSRSTSLVIAYLMWREGQSFDDAFQFVKAARGIADPNMGFACQLLQCQKRVHAFPLSPSSLLRMFRIAPHSPYDPLHLVPKMLTDPSSYALDSRGAFIVHIPEAIYVWIGKKCEAIMERDARGAVGQIVRYERVQGPIIMVKEGEEPASFWDTFSNFLPLMDTSGSRVENSRSSVRVWPDERKVDAYDVDFEVFKKAITGGFVPPFASSENEHETHLPARESSWSALRRKVSYSNIKEFVSAPKLSIPRVYSDSMLCIHTAANASPSPSLSLSSTSSSSSSSSSFFISPASISSDSSTHSKFLSELSPDSSSLVLTCKPVSSSLSNFSNLSLSSNSTSQTVSNSTGIHDVELFHPHSQAASLPLKKPPASLAERRGNLSKSLKLPPMNDKTQVDKPSTLPASRGHGNLVNSNYSCVQHSDSIDYLFESNNPVKDGGANSIQQCEPALCPGNYDGVGHEESSVPRNCVEPSVVDSCSSREDFKFTPPEETNESGSLQCRVTQTFVHRWPGLEKIEIFGANHLDSEAAFVIFSRSVHVNAGNIMYFWVGKSFNRDASQVRLDSDRQTDFLGVVDWNRIGSDLIAQFSLPKNTVVKV